MANRIFDEASLLQAAAILRQQQFQQHQQTLLAQANLLAMQQAESSAFLARAASQVWEIPDVAKNADEKERLIPERKLVSQAHRIESGFELWFMADLEKMKSPISMAPSLMQFCYILGAWLKG